MKEMTKPSSWRWHVQINILCQVISKKVYYASGGLLFWMFTIIFLALTIIVFPLHICFVVSYFFYLYCCLSILIAVCFNPVNLNVMLDLELTLRKTYCTLYSIKRWINRYLVLFFIQISHAIAIFCLISLLSLVLNKNIVFN